MKFSTRNNRNKLSRRCKSSNTLKPFLIIVALCFATQTEAQLWKKLTKTAEKAVERTLEKKVDEKASRETDKAFDSTLNSPSNKKKKTKGTPIGFGSSKTPESTYRFSHKYILEINDGKRTNEIIYYLNSHGDYNGSTIPDTKGSNLINVMDMKNKALFMFMDNDGAKQLMAMDMNFDIEGMVDDAVDDTEYSAKPTGRTKTILGYLAKEYKTKGKNMHGTAWITNAVDVSLFKAFSSQKIKKGINKSWMKNMDGLMLEMTITDTSKRKPKTITMTCTTLKKENLTIDTSEYKKIL